MPAVRKLDIPDVTEDPVEVAMCANHPDVPAAHTTGTKLHQAISLCTSCLKRVGSHLRQR